MFIDNSSSIWKECLNEVPEESVLDHLQFNIFINDLDEEVEGILIRSVGNKKLMDARLKNIGLTVIELNLVGISIKFFTYEIKIKCTTIGLGILGSTSVLKRFSIFKLIVLDLI